MFTFKNIFLIIVIFLDIKYINTRPYSNKILSQNFKPIKERKEMKAEKNSRVKFLENGLRKKTF